MVERFLSTPGDQGARLDQFLAQQSPALSRTTIRKIIDLGGVHVDGRRARKAGLALTQNQRIELYRDAGSLEPYRLEAGQVLYQDEYVIALNKPSGIETQPTQARYRGTLYEALQVWLERDRRFGRRLEIGMAQRLDRETSGVIVFSIHPRAHKSLTTQMQTRSASKIYLALVEGRPEPEQGSFHSNLIRDRYANRMKSTADGGKEAVTSYRVLRTVEIPAVISLVEIVLITGRTHQIRAHFSEAGHPLLGDLRYGGSRSCGGWRVERQCLHSYRLELDHPVTGRKLRFTADLPADMDLDRCTQAV